MRVTWCITQPICSRALVFASISFCFKKAFHWNGKQVIATTIFAELFIGMVLKSFMPFKHIQENISRERDVPCFVAFSIAGPKISAAVVISKAGFLKAKLNLFSLFLEHALYPPLVKQFPERCLHAMHMQAKPSEIFPHCQNQPRLMTPCVRICYPTALVRSFELHFKLGSLKRR